MKRLIAITLVVLTLITRLAAQDFTIGDLNYSINEDGVSVTVTGHVDGTNATGELIIPESVTYNDIIYPVTIIRYSAFDGCNGLTGTLVIPNSVIEIGKFAFNQCYGFDGLIIGNFVTNIKRWAFYKCEGFKGSLVIPSSVTTIEEYAFYHCSGFDGTLTIGESVTYIGANAFDSCYGFTGTLIIPNSVITIDEYSFEYCHGFEHLVLGESVKEIKTFAFGDCDNLSGPLVIPNSVVTIGLNAFYSCDGLDDTLIIGENVEHIASGAFMYIGGFNKVFILAEEPPTLDNPAFDYPTNHILNVPCGCANAYQNSSWSDHFNIFDEDCFNNEFAPQGAEWYYNRVTINNETLDYSRSYVAGYDTIQSHPCTRIKHTFLVENDEFMYENDGTVYWYNPKIDAFTVLYKFNAKIGDRWISRIEDHVYEITVSAVDYYIWNEHTYKILDIVAHDLESTWKYYNEKIICGIGYDTGLIPYHWPYENLLFESPHIDYLRCYLQDGELLYHQGDYDCYYIPGNEPTFPILGDEWYYEITNENGSITYQYLECANDTTIGTTRPKVIVKSNTLYDKGLNVVKTHEYVYSDNGIVYWWDKLSGSYTTLYNFNANVGDEWTISVDNQSITMHVDAVSYTEYSGTVYRIMTVSDAQDIFSGQIICGIGHTRSFFPERLLSKNRNYRVDGMRCYWVDGEPIIQFGDVDCDEVYEEHHKTTPPSNPVITVYPNPANDLITVNVKNATDYTIFDIFGRIVLKGVISSDNQQIDISELSCGMYFIKTDEILEKFIKK